MTISLTDPFPKFTKGGGNMRGWRIEDGKTWLKEEPQMGGAGGFSHKERKDHKKEVNADERR
jgi:hypothetical protein